MLELKAKVREATGKRVKILRQRGLVPAVLYGPKIKKNELLEINLKEFEKVFKEAGESSLISLKIEDAKGENLVLIHEIEKDPLTGSPSHIDFYQPDLEKEIEAKVSLVFEGESLACKDLGGTLIKNVSEVRVKAKPQLLPKEIRIDIAKLKTLEDNILVEDLLLPEGAKVLKDAKDIIAFAVLPEKIEEELAKPVEEKVAEVQKAEEKKEESVSVETSAKQAKK